MGFKQAGCFFRVKFKAARAVPGNVAKHFIEHVHRADQGGGPDPDGANIAFNSVYFPRAVSACQRCKEFPARIQRRAAAVYAVKLKRQGP